MRIWDFIEDKIVETINNAEFEDDIRDELGEMDSNEVEEMLEMSFEEVAKRIKRRLGI